MKKWLKLGLFLTAFTGMTAITRYDVDNQLWFLALAAWVIGTYMLVRSLKPVIEKEIKRLKDTGGKNDYIFAFLTTGVSIAVIAVLFAVGFTGEFRFNTCFVREFAEDQGFVSCILNDIMINAAMTIMIAFITLFLIVFSGIVVKGDIQSDLPGTVGWKVVYFIMLSQLCGVIDLATFLAWIGDVVKRFFN